MMCDWNCNNDPAERRALAGHTPNCPMDPCALIASCQIQRLQNELRVAQAQLRAAKKAISTAAHGQGDFSLRDQLARTLLADVDRAGKPRPRAARGIR